MELAISIYLQTGFAISFLVLGYSMAQDRFKEGPGFLFGAFLVFFFLSLVIAWPLIIWLVFWLDKIEVFNDE